MNQYQQKMGQAAQATKQVEQSNKNLVSSFQGLQAALSGAIAAAGISQVIQLVGEYNQLGTQVNANTRIFSALTQGMGDQAMIMAQLRESTGGVVSDLDLMAGSNKLLKLGIVDSADGMSHLLDMIVKLKAPTESVTDAISDFGALLANESVLRLDNFGLSSARVRERVEELKNAGLDASAAFKQATFEEMEKQIGRLGDAADVAETNLAKLQTRIENVQQAIGSQVNKGVEAYAGAVVGGLDLAETAANFGDRLRSNLDKLYGTNFGQSVAPMAFYSKEQIQNATMLMTVQDRTKEAWSAASEALSGYLRRLGEYQTTTEKIVDRGAQFRDILGLSNGETQDSFFDLSKFQNTLMDLRQDTGSTLGGTTFFSPEVANRAKVLADTTAEMVDDLKKLGDAGFEIPENTVNSMKEIADEAKQFSDQAQKGADALAGLTTAKLFGQTNGGLAGQLADQVIAAMQSSGASADQIAQMQSALDLGTGRQTGASLASSNFIQQLVESGADPQHVLAAILHAQGVAQAAGAAGVNMSQLFSAGNMPWIYGYSGGGAGRMIDVQKGDDLYSLSARYNMSVDSLRPLLDSRGILHTGQQSLGGGVGEYIGGDPQTLVDSYQAMQQATDAMATSSGEADDSFQSIQNTTQAALTDITDMGASLQDILGQGYTLKIDLIANGPEWLKAFLAGNGADLSKAMSDATKANGGTPPGQTPTRRSGRVIDR